jgi:glutathione peroxidase-family protein
MRNRFFQRWLLAPVIALCMNAAIVKAAPLATDLPLPEFFLKNVDGKMLSSADLADKPILVIVFASNHCPFVQSYEGRLAALQKSYAGKGVQLLLVNSNDPQQQPQDNFETMQTCARDKGFPFPYLWDSEQKLAHALGAERTPEVFVFGKDRKLIYQGRIDDNTEEMHVRKHDLQTALDLLIAGTPEKIDSHVTKAFGCTMKWKP